MKSAILTLAAVLASVCVGSAQTPATYESITVGSAAVGLATTTYAPTGQPQMPICLARLEVAEIRYRVDRTAPTAAEGMLLEPGEALPLLTPEEIGAASFIRTGATSGVLKVTCWRTPRSIDFRSSTQLAGYSWTDGTNPTATSAGAVTQLLATTDGRLAVTTDHPKRFDCHADNSAATTLTALGGACAAPGAGLSFYITDINFSSSVASTTTADQQFEIKFGTGGACGTGTTVAWNQFGGATAPVVAQFITPIKVTANNELCWMMAATGNKSVHVKGYIAP